MKKIFFFVVLIIGVLSISYGQIEKPITKGHFMVGGLVSFNRKVTEVHFDDNTYSQKLSVFELSPNFAYFVLSRFAVGLQISLTLDKNVENDKYIIISRSIAFLPYLRYYIYSGLFGEAAFGYGFKKAEDYKSTTINGKISCGYTFFLSKTVGLEPIISYAFEEKVFSDIDYKSKVNYLRASLSLQVFF